MPAPATIRDRRAGVAVAFVARAEGVPWDYLAPGTVTASPGGGMPVASCVQEHSARVLEARPAVRERADALYTTRRGLALAVVTADCVPVLIATPDAIAAVHAGWRGLANGVLANAAGALGASTGRGWVAWVGPAIGACCYEVSWHTAISVASRAGGYAIVHRPPSTGRSRPHLDLQAAARRSLERLGVHDVRVVRRCTRCDDADAGSPPASPTAGAWASFRRDGNAAGRNLALIWREDA